MNAAEIHQDVILINAFQFEGETGKAGIVFTSVEEVEGELHTIS